MTGQEINAKTALEWGIVNQVRPCEQIYDRTRELVEGLHLDSASTTETLIQQEVRRSPCAKFLSRLPCIISITAGQPQPNK